MLELNFALQVNLNDFPIQDRPRKMRCATLMEEQMKHDPIKGWILRVTVPVPVRDMHVQFDIALEHLFPVHSERRVDEIWTGLAIPESELDNLDEGAGNSTESGPERAGVPHGLPLELGPFFGKIIYRLT